MWRSVLHVESSLLIARAALWLGLVLLGSLGMGFVSQGLLCVATLMLAVPAYRILYKR